MKKFLQLSTLIALIVLFSQCEQDRPKVAFSLSSKEVRIGEEVQFNNTSSGAESYTWYFGDGETSKLENPMHEYTLPGEYFITLIAFNGNAKAVAYATIIVGGNCGKTPLNVIFTNKVFTPIEITVNGDTRSIEPGEFTEYYFSNNPCQVEYYAETQSKLTDGTTIGEHLEWDNIIDVDGLEEKTTNFIIDNSFFFTYIQNNSDRDISSLEIYSPSTEYYMIEDLNIPNNNVLYKLGYYETYSDIIIESWDLYWANGLNINLSMQDNQWVLLHTDDAYSQLLKSAVSVNPEIAAMPLSGNSPIVKSTTDKLENTTDVAYARKKLK